MKKLTKLFAFIFVVTFIFNSVVCADNIQSYYYVSNNVEIEIVHSGLSDEQLLRIVALFDNDNDNQNAQQSRGLMCTLFGHDYTSTIANVTTHMVYDTYPYCKQERYQIDLCERCDHTETTLLETFPIGCCTK